MKWMKIRKKWLLFSSSIKANQIDCSHQCFFRAWCWNLEEKKKSFSTLTYQEEARELFVLQLFNPTLLCYSYFQGLFVTVIFCVSIDHDSFLDYYLSALIRSWNEWCNDGGPLRSTFCEKCIQDISELAPQSNHTLHYKKHWHIRAVAKKGGSYK